MSVTFSSVGFITFFRIALPFFWLFFRELDFRHLLAEPWHFGTALGTAGLVKLFLFHWQVDRRGYRKGDGCLNFKNVTKVFNLTQARDTNRSRFRIPLHVDKRPLQPYKVI